MLSFFFDASIIFSAVYSKTGASRELFNLALLDKVVLTTSEYAFKEAKRRIESKYPHLIAEFEQMENRGVFRLVEADKQDIIEALSIIADPFDAPIIAAAKKSKCVALISFDTGHMHNQAVAAFIGAPVMKAGDALQMVISRKNIFD
ncbi:MAG: PIN domain-containing protein [Chloroflexi bacterium]|jgi:predicted nucleic acid-binding protein|nr:PIN domain-containing protein [Chloroflexota bacterium]